MHQKIVPYPFSTKDEASRAEDWYLAEQKEAERIRREPVTEKYYVPPPPKADDYSSRPSYSITGLGIRQKLKSLLD